MGTKNVLIVFYNTRCPICDSGISFQRNRLLIAVKAGLIGFRDINAEPDALIGFQASLEDVRKRLHALDGQTLLVGADVALAVWALTPGQAWMSKIFGHALIRPASRFVYNMLAECLYAWNRHKWHW
jgi:predicted DCC family thiol-disulfide oxidoreductase YuxK